VGISKSLNNPIRKLNAFSLASKLMMGYVNPLVSSTAKIRRETCFMAKGEGKEVQARLVKELKNQNANPTIKNQEIKCFLHLHNNLLTFTIEILPVKGGFAMVEVRRGKGDILEFNRFYRGFVTSIKDIILEKKN
jgi:hypothetical protein